MDTKSQTFLCYTSSKVLTKEEQEKLLDAIKGHELELLYIVALGTGLRIGEILGLKWSDIDFKSNELDV